MATGSVPITPGSGQNVAVDTNTGLAGGAAVQIMAPANSDGTRMPNDPDGTIQVSNDPTALFLDDFSGTLATNWSTGGTTAPTSSAGVLNTSQSTTASVTSYLRSLGTFLLRPASYLRIAMLVNHNAAAVTNNVRWWGYGQNQTTPSSGAPVLNGAVFMLESDGTFKIATYSAGTRNNVFTITRPSDNAYHRYEIFYRQSVIYFQIDGVTVGSIVQPNLAVATNMYLIAGSANFTTAPTAAPQLSISSAAVADASRTNHTISDGLNPYVQATVKAASTATVATDQPLVVGLHPTSPLPGGGNVIGAIRVQGTASAYSLTTAASTNAGVIKAAAGFLQELTISNPTATAAYVKIYNKASAPTVGTDVPVMTIRMPATGTAGDFQNLDLGANGKYFTTGIAIAVTAAAAYTDTAVAVAGVQIHGTYV